MSTLATGPDSPGIESQAAAASEAPILSVIEQTNLVFQQQLAMQNAIAHQQAMGHLRLAVVAKCADMIFALDPNDANAPALMAQIRDLLDVFERRVAAIDLRKV